MTRVQVTHLGMKGTGTTLREAKAAAARRAVQALAGDYQPRLLYFRGHRTLVYRTPHDGWCRVRIDENTKDIDILYGTIGHPDTELADVLRAARCSMAQLGWDEVEEESPFIHDPADQAEFRSWVRFQKLYRRWRASGADERCAWGKAAAGIEPGDAESGGAAGVGTGGG